MKEKNELTASFEMGIQKSPLEVTEAIVNGKMMAGYFLKESSGRMEVGKTVMWTFPEFPESFPVKVQEVIPGKLIRFIWDPKSCVRIDIREEKEGTVVKVTETGYSDDEEGIKWAVRQAGGWGSFLTALKAYLEYGINLRKGAYFFMK